MGPTYPQLIQQIAEYATVDVMKRLARDVISLTRIVEDHDDLEEVDFWIDRIMQGSAYMFLGLSSFGIDHHHGLLDEIWASSLLLSDVSKQWNESEWPRMHAAWAAFLLVTMAAQEGEWGYPAELHEVERAALCAVAVSRQAESTIREVCREAALLWCRMMEDSHGDLHTYEKVTALLIRDDVTAAQLAEATPKHTRIVPMVEFARIPFNVE